jgi:hypothetical protein
MCAELVALAVKKCRLLVENKFALVVGTPTQKGVKHDLAVRRPHLRQPPLEAQSQCVVVKKPAASAD